MTLCLLVLTACERESQILTQDEFGALPPFDARVVEAKPRARIPGARYHSAAIEPYTVTVETTDGRRLTVDHVGRDANWPWVAKSLIPGRTYRFPEALFKQHGPAGVPAR